MLELRAAAHRCCCGIGLLECCCALLRSSCAPDEEELLRYCADARLKMAPFAVLVRAMLMAMPTPVVERCAGCRGGMLVPDAALDVSESRCDAAVCAAAVRAAAVYAAAERRCSCARCSPAKAAAGAKGRVEVQQQRCRWRCRTSTAVPLSGRFKMCAMSLTCACCELGGDAVENLKPVSAARGPRAPTPTTAAPRYYMRN